MISVDRHFFDKISYRDATLYDQITSNINRCKVTNRQTNKLTDKLTDGAAVNLPLPTNDGPALDGKCVVFSFPLCTDRDRFLRFSIAV